MVDCIFASPLSALLFLCLSAALGLLFLAYCKQNCRNPEMKPWAGAGEVEETRNRVSSLKSPDNVGEKKQLS